VELVRGPYLQSLLSTTVDVVWVTDAHSQGKVEWTGPDGVPRVAHDSARTTDHRVRLTALAPDAVHRYRIFDEETPLAPEAAFRTSPPPRAGEFRAVVIGDSGSGLDEQKAVAQSIQGLKPDIFLHTGDLDYLGNVDSSVFGPYREILPSAGFFPSRGNHDLFLPWFALFFPPMDVRPIDGGAYFSFDWGSAHFVALDTNLLWTIADKDSDQLKWLEADLEKAKDGGTAWTILYFHEPVFSVGAYARERLQRDLIAPIAERFGVDLVLSGHDHNYQRSHPVREEIVHDAWQDPAFVSPRGPIYLVTGGGGQLLYSELALADHRFTRVFRESFHAVELVISPARLLVRAVSPYDGVLDEFTIERGPRPQFAFIRGDVNQDGAFDITDPVLVLGHLFLGSPIGCEVLADADDSGLPLLLDDAIRFLFHLFLEGEPPAAPFHACGIDPDADDAFCAEMACPR